MSMNSINMADAPLDNFRDFLRSYFVKIYPNGVPHCKLMEIAQAVAVGGALLAL